MSKTVNILGSTGSIGRQALDVVSRLGGWEVASLCAGSNAQLLEEQIRRFKPRYAALLDERAARDLRTSVADLPVKVYAGAQGVCECAGVPADISLNAIVGMAGLRPTLAALETCGRLALANKETLVAAGRLVTAKAQEKKVKILPVDSEHSAIFQCLEGAPEPRPLKRIILTASGGPFAGMTRRELEDVTAEQAMRHPNWSMGAKITVDSATMFNKGLELIEAVWLFAAEPSRIDILIHRQSVVHSMVEFIDGSVIAQLGVPDMRIPIQYALTWPRRFRSPVKQLRLEEYDSLTFEKPDDETFGAVSICRRAAARGGLSPAAVNSANEEANALFRAGKIGFLDIARLTAAAVDAVPAAEDYTLEDVEAADLLARQAVLRQIA
ncbi:MAG TPA: 1-deoxy-D-xylulose-5-phosphate reductoisomerase [Clostridiales bacterium]|nr:MAG: 1-deoxy-D-xylulose 5-phosphate reductoisomerase [Firmicutes bacterium ADurb.Bin262]HOU10726.1 1-deoxy-D-xylulose-5-phosphate reductoisomerase [Clostridiales bacterium]HQK73530.1 1-deoxy-D-xylulose-5-phosphate reductoisomerase [Clostridiales bacterium]